MSSFNFFCCSRSSRSSFLYFVDSHVAMIDNKSDKLAMISLRVTLMSGSLDFDVLVSSESPLQSTPHFVCDVLEDFFDNFDLVLANIFLILAYQFFLGHFPVAGDTHHVGIGRVRIAHKFKLSATARWTKQFDSTLVLV